MLSMKRFHGPYNALKVSAKTEIFFLEKQNVSRDPAKNSKVLNKQFLGGVNEKL
jgi:hypothetical protein